MPLWFRRALRCKDRLSFLLLPTMAMLGGAGGLGPAWTRGEIEAPLGEKVQGSMTMAVYTLAQQRRLGVDEAGNPAALTVGLSSMAFQGTALALGAEDPALATLKPLLDAMPFGEMARVRHPHAIAAL